MRLFLLTALMAVDWRAPQRRLGDLALGAASLGVGVWLAVDWLIWGGVLGLALAWLMPMHWLQIALAPKRKPAPRRLGDPS